MLTTENARGLVSNQPPQEQKVMNVRIKRNTVAGGKAVNEGDLLDLPTHEAQLLIAMGKAELDQAVTITEKPEIETAELKVEAESTDVKSPRKKKG